MLSSTRTSWRSVAASLLLFASLCSAHTVISYPGWRGNNLLPPNGTGAEFVESGGLGVGPDNTYPYGMQWIYPCGGMPVTTNRTKWPIHGGAVAWQPGWFPGHSFAFTYINLGIGTLPINMSMNMVPVFQIQGPTNDIYNGSVCLPQVPLPANYTPSIGDNATIQLVEAAQHGAALYSCVDITFAEPEDVEQVGPDNCFNSSDIQINLVYGTQSLTSGALSISSPQSIFASIPLIAAIVCTLLI